MTCVFRQLKAELGWSGGGGGRWRYEAAAQPPLKYHHTHVFNTHSFIKIHSLHDEAIWEHALQI